MRKLEKYFAYGSNLHFERLRERAPSARVIGWGELPGHVLRFHKRGKDGSGKCNAFYTGLPQDRVLGALFELDDRDKSRLDVEESLGYGYNRLNLSIHLNGSQQMAFLYLAQKNYIDDSLAPYCWYKAYVQSGARFHGLPGRYIEDRIDSVSCLPDPETARAVRHYAMLGGQK